MIIAPVKNVTISYVGGVSVTLNGRNPFIFTTAGYSNGIVGGYPSIMFLSDAVTNYRPGIFQWLGEGNCAFSYSTAGYGTANIGLFGNVIYSPGDYNQHRWAKTNIGVDPLTGIVNSYTFSGWNGVSDCGGTGGNTFLMPYVSQTGGVISTHVGMLGLSPSGVATAPYSSASGIETYSNRYNMNLSSSYPLCPLDDDKVVTCTSNGVVGVFRVAQYISNGGSCAASSIGATLQLLYSIPMSSIVGGGFNMSQYNAAPSQRGGFTVCGYNGSYWVVYILWPYVWPIRLTGSIPGGLTMKNAYIDDNGYLFLITAPNANTSSVTIYKSNTFIDMSIALNKAAPPRDPQPVNTTNILSTRFSK